MHANWPLERTGCAGRYADNASEKRGMNESR